MRASVGLLALVALVGVSGCSGTASRPAGSPSRRVVYRVVDTSTGTARTTTAVTDVAPPYRARTVSHLGDSPTGPPLGGFAWDETGVYSIAPDGAVSQSEQVGPGFPGPFSRLDLALPVAARQGLVASLGIGTAAGRSCTRWLSQSPLDGAPLSAATAADRTESCVDAAGTVLSERWQVAGSLVRTRTVTALTAGPPLGGPGLFDHRSPTALPPGGSAYVVHPSTPAELSRLMAITAPTGPVGLRADRAAAVLDLDATRHSFARESAVLTWTGPGHLAVLRLERDLEAGAGRTIRGAPVELGPLGTGQLEPVLAGLQVTVAGPRGIRIVATADLPEPALLAWIRSLQFGG